MKKRFLLPLIATAAITGVGVYGHNINVTCIPGNADFEAGTGLCIAKNRSALIAEAKANAAKVAKAKAEAKKQAEKQAAEAKAKAERDAAIAKANAQKAAAEAKFKAEGWAQVRDGIYVRWCTDTCNNSKVIGDNRYALMEVWAKDRAAGDIYARVNLVRDGVVIGWTNDTTYLSQGQRGVLTFDSYQYFDTAELTEFNARG